MIPTLPRRLALALVAAAAAILIPRGGTNAQLLHPQTNTFASTFTLTDPQIHHANLTPSESHNLELAIRYERSARTYPHTHHPDPFYDLPADYNPNDPLPLGTVLKVEQYTNVSHYTLPMGLGMSRFLYMTETVRGEARPASAAVLWPYVPRKFARGKRLTSCAAGKESREGDGGGGGDVYPIIALAHGTSGQNAICAPSAFRALWDDFHEPFPLALAGYAVIAPDFLGLGVVANETSPYFVFPSQANDVFFAVEAAQKIWASQLSREFVVAGQSQGGSVAWSAAQRQAEKPMQGYLGAVALSPFTDVLATVARDDQAQDNGRVVGIAQGLSSVLPGFKMSEWVTDAGIARWELMREIGGCGVASGQIFDTDVKILKDGWNLTESAKRYNELSRQGGKDKPFASPLLVGQGVVDTNANDVVNSRTVEETCEAFPDQSLEYIRFENIAHVPILYASQHLFLDWIYDRFAGVPASKGCSMRTFKPGRGAKVAQFDAFADQNWLVQYDQYGINPAA